MQTLLLRASTTSFLALLSKFWLIISSYVLVYANCDMLLLEMRQQIGQFFR